MLTGSNGREFYGLKDDRQAMPTDGIENGAVFHELDSGKRFKFDAENKEWYPWTGE